VGVQPAEADETGAVTEEFYLRRSREGPLRATFLELFFDLAYIFAFTQLSDYLIANLGWAGAGRTLVLLLPLWWLWTATSWITDSLDPARTAVQIQVVVVMVGSLVMGVAVPAAYGSARPIFAGTYVAAQVGTGIYYGFVLRRSRQRLSSQRTLFWFGLSGIFWLAGAFMHGSMVEALWAFAAVVDYAAPRLRWPTPGLGRVPDSDFRLAGEHVSERYRQFFIIALGETILTSGLTLSHSGLDVWRVVAFVAAFAITVMLGRIYIYRAGELLETALRQARETSRPSEVAAVVHLVMIAGVVITAAADEIVIAHPLEHARPAWVVTILAGPAVFLAGRALLDYTVFTRVSWSRVAGLVVLAAAAPALLHGPTLAAAAASLLVLVGIVAANAATWRRSPRPTAPLGGSS
jgi:low temperature requirement protein LtrA